MAAQIEPAPAEKPDKNDAWCLMLSMYIASAMDVIMLQRFRNQKQLIVEEEAQGFEEEAEKKTDENILRVNKLIMYSGFVYEDMRDMLHATMFMWAKRQDEALLEIEPELLSWLNTCVKERCPMEDIRPLVYVALGEYIIDIAPKISTESLVINDVDMKEACIHILYQWAEHIHEYEKLDDELAEQLSKCWQSTLAFRRANVDA